MREKRAADPGAATGRWMAPVEMPVQTYQWNKRAVADNQPDPDVPGAVAVAAPEAPPTPPPMPVAADTWAAPPPAAFLPTTRPSDPTFGGLAGACAVALAVPLGLTFAVEGMAWRHGSGTNASLLGVVAVIVLVGSCLIGLLSSELGRHRSLGRGLAAAALAGVTTGLLAVLVDAHPGKFGFDLGAGFLLALVGPVLAFLLASTIGPRR